MFVEITSKVKLQEFYGCLWGNVSVEVWSASGHFVPLTTRAIDLGSAA